MSQAVRLAADHKAAAPIAAAAAPLTIAVPPDFLDEVAAFVRGLRYRGVIGRGRRAARDAYKSEAEREKCGDDECTHLRSP